jgi:hypothetical protein
MQMADQTASSLDELLGAQTALNDAVEALVRAQHAVADATVGLLPE